MTLTLKIENETSLPDGGPLSVSVAAKRGIDIGRDQHLDWTLPDPTRYISGKHCEVRYRDGAYWLYDVSTNGTILYGSEGRLKGPHRLRHGDRLVIGNYIIGVTLEGEDAAPPPAPPSPPVAYADLWNSTQDAAPAVDPSQILAPSQRPAPVRPDFLDWAVDVPDPLSSPVANRRAAREQRALPEDDLSWAQGTPKQPPPVAPEPEVPTPRRPMWITNEPDGPWGGQATSRPAAEAREPPQPAPPMSEPPQPAPPIAEPPQTDASPPDPIPAVRPGPPAGFARALARGAGLPDEVLSAQNPDELAEQIGGLLRMIAENMRQLLKARLQAKRMARSSKHTEIEALNNNPLKFSISAEEALRNMFGPRTRGYLDARQSFEQGFRDVKAHQVQTFAAMQQAITLLLAELDPQTIDTATEADRGIAALVVSRKARLWDAYVARWQALGGKHNADMLEHFMRHFAECYDRAGQDSR